MARPKILTPEQIKINKANYNKNYAKSKTGKVAISKANKKYNSISDKTQIDGIKPTTKARFLRSKNGREITHDELLNELMDLYASSSR
jgi:hypothetical protein